MIIRLKTNHNEAEFFQLLDWVSISKPFQDHLPLMLRVWIVTRSAFSPILDVTMNETSLPLLEIVAEHRFDPVFTHLAVGCGPSSLLSPRLAALKVAVSDSSLNIAPGDFPTTESVAAETRGWQILVRERDTEVRKLECRLWLDAGVNDMHGQVHEMTVQLHGAKVASRTFDQCLQVITASHRDRMQAFFELAATMR